LANENTINRNAPLISVIIPVHNGGAGFTKCLEALAASVFRNYELVVVDDGSRDGSAGAAREAGARVFSHEAALGAAAARNRGAAEARGEILFFLDADVLVQADTLTHVAAFFAAGDADALIGSYTPDTPAGGFFSRFKNVHHHYIHQISNPDASTFWTGCGAVRRAAFAGVRGFDHAEYGGATIEDIELGYRLKAAGYRIRLDKNLQVAHLKRYNLWTLMRSDVVYRAIPWTKLMLLGNHYRSDLNTTPANALSVLLAAAIIGCLCVAPFWPWTLLGVVVGLSLFTVNTLPFNSYVKRHFGWGFTISTMLMSVWYFFYAGIGFTLGIVAAVWEIVTARAARERRRS
jgi:glycosyltransferase involved in cell wall biosynthesis